MLLTNDPTARLFLQLHGRIYQITALFTSVDEANDFMAHSHGQSVLREIRQGDDRLILCAEYGDKGKKIKL